MPFTKGDGTPHARVANPLAEDEPFLRKSLLDTLARRAEFNLNRHEGNVRLFEIGSAFVPDGDGLPREEVRAARARHGRAASARISPIRSRPRSTRGTPSRSPETIARAAFPGSEDPAAGRRGAGSSGRCTWSMPSRNPEIGPEQDDGSVDDVARHRASGASGPFARSRSTRRSGPRRRSAWRSRSALMPSTPVAAPGQHRLRGGRPETAARTSCA